jgi:tetratricopeptide (TPR) repeat protein
VRIPLDYYQILAVTERNLPELEQAYQDRLRQLPRKGYSDAAIESRKQLIKLAHRVLSDPQQREQYEAERLPSVPIGADDLPSTADPATSVPAHRHAELDITPEHFLGGLLILFERGEYEEINSICMPYLGNNGHNSNSGSLHPRPLATVTPSSNLQIEPMITIEETDSIADCRSVGKGDRVIPLKPDIVLTMVFSFLELGAREWRNSRYEDAVIHFETARKILVQEDLFPQIQGQIDRRLDRLRPYRILSLVSLEFDRQEQRREGIKFLEELLESACRDEVECQKRFGLSSERTIQFIHETLPSLTATEQRNLFSQIARDAYQMDLNALSVMQLACTYLHVYALVAQGFAYRNPQSIYTAQQILQSQLSHKLDVTIEQAICAVLLGQTEEANRLLTAAAKSPALMMIRQHALGAADLLSGLCWYIESWLKDEVFPCFRDLVESNPDLNDYYHNRDVVDFIDRLPAADLSILAWDTHSLHTTDTSPSGNPAPVQYPSQPDSSDELVSAHPELLAADVRPVDSLNTAVRQLSQDRLGSGNVDPAQRVEQIQSTSPAPVNTADIDTSAPLESQTQSRHLSSISTTRTIDGHFEEIYPENYQETTVFVAETASNSQLVPTTRKNQQLTQRDRAASTMVRSRRPRRKPNIPRILLVCAGGLTCLWGLIWLVNAAFRSLTAPPLVSTSPATISVTKSAPTKPESKPQPPAPQLKPPVGLLTKDIAQQAVKNWLNAKSKSLSQQYQTDRLKDIVVDPALSLALDRVKTAKAEGIHWVYKHPEISIEPIPSADAMATSATIQAQVKENAEYYKDNRLDPTQSYSQKLLVEYNLVRQKDRWYVKNMDVIKSLDSSK